MKLRGSVLFASAPAERLIEMVGLPSRGLPVEVNGWRERNQAHLERGYRKIAIAREHGIPHYYGALRVRTEKNGRRFDYGLASLRVVTSAGTEKVVSALLGDPFDFTWHGLGTGTALESPGDTALAEELDAEYEDGRQSGAATVGVIEHAYRTTTSIQVASAVDVCEHGVFDAVTGGTMLDRSVFADMELEANEIIHPLYELVFDYGM